MPIRVNLLAEAQAAEESRRRDPVKRAVYCGVFLFVFALAWSSTLQLETMGANRNLSRVQTEIESHTNEYDRVIGGVKSVADTQKKLAELQGLTAARFLQGNLLDALQKFSLPNIALIRIRAAQTYQFKDVKPAPQTVEHIVISLDVRDSSPNPGDAVNKFKDLVSSQPYIQSILGKTNGVRLASLSPPQIGADGKAFVLFTLECQLPDQTR